MKKLALLFLFVAQSSMATEGAPKVLRFLRDMGGPVEQITLDEIDLSLVTGNCGALHYSGNASLLFGSEFYDLDSIAFSRTLPNPVPPPQPPSFVCHVDGESGAATLARGAVLVYRHREIPAAQIQLIMYPLGGDTFQLVFGNEGLHGSVTESY